MKWNDSGYKRDVDGIIEFSQDRAYNIDEESYDERYRRGLDVNTLKAQGEAFKNFCLDNSINSDGPLLEVGCGTGRLTGIVLASELFPRMLVTDGSKAFTRITKRNIQTLMKHGFGAEVRIDYGNLVDDDFESLPKDTFSAVSLYAVLHHFVDWKLALKTIKPCLKRNGAVFFSEPSAEFMMISGLICTVFTAHAESLGIKLDEQEQRLLRAMKNASSLRVGYDLEPKLKQEDKHAFRIDDIFSAAEELGYKFMAYPDASFGKYGGELMSKELFIKTAMHRFEVVNGFPSHLIEKMSAVMEPSLEWLSNIAASGAGPHFDCLYVLHRAD